MAQLGREMSSRELTEWMAYYGLEPFGQPAWVEPEPDPVGKKLAAWVQQMRAAGKVIPKGP